MLAFLGMVSMSSFRYLGIDVDCVEIPAISAAAPGWSSHNLVIHFNICNSLLAILL